jgi:hypothetical protein
MGKKNNGDIPPPLTRKSSRTEMWENIEAMSQEIDAQQREILELRALEKMRSNKEQAKESAYVMLQWQLELIRHVLSLKPQS